MNTLWKDIRFKLLHSDSKLPMLIGINVIVFLVINVSAVIEQLFTGFGNSAILNYSVDYLQLPASFTLLATRFWTPITYMFMHDGIFHILFNMLWLYWMGQLFEEYLGNKRIVSLYILGGLAGALFFLLAYNFLPAFANSGLRSVYIAGASASVLAIVVATATLLPDYTIFMMFIGPVKLKWLAIAFVLIDFLSIVGPNAGGEIAHLGGALLGFIYIKQLKRGNDWSGSITGLFKPKAKIKVVSKNANYKDKPSAPRQDEIDTILDKISQSGYDSLSKQEKEILFRASGNDR